MKHDLDFLLCLTAVPGVGPYRIRNLISKFGRAKHVLEAGISELCLVEGIDEKTAGLIHQQQNQKFADEQIRLAEKNHIDIVTYWDASYPAILTCPDTSV